MAVVAWSLRYDHTLLSLASRENLKQLKFYIPAKEEANKPGMIVLGNVDGSGVLGTGVSIWADSSGNVRVASGEPSAPESDGTVIGVASVGADTALSNIASVAIPVDLAPASANAVDFGTDAKPLRSVYARTSIIFDQTTRNLTLTASEPGTLARTVNFDDPGANDSVAYLAASQALTTKSYNGLTVACATANAMSLTRGTAGITLAEGNTDITLGAGAQLTLTGTGAIAVANAKTLTVNDNLTVSTAVTLDQALAIASSPTFNVLTVTRVTDGTASLTLGALSGITTLGTTSHVSLVGDSKFVYFGASSPADSYIGHVAAGDLTFYDPNVGHTVTLSDLIGYTGTFAGDVTITDGKLTWSDLVNEVAGVWSFSSTTNDAIQIASSITTADTIQLTSNSMSSGTAIKVIASDAVLTTGNYFGAYDSVAAAFDWEVGAYGANTIKGTAGADVFTITAGDVAIGDGSITLTDADEATTISITNNTLATSSLISITANGITSGDMIYGTTTSAGVTTGKFIRFYDSTAGAHDDYSVGLHGATVIAGVAATDMFTIDAGDIKLTLGDIRLTDGVIVGAWDTDEGSTLTKNHATSTSAVLAIKQDHTGGTGTVLDLEQDATGNAYGLKITHDGDYPAIDITAGAARTGDVITVAMANQLAQKAVNITGAWTGATDVGLIDLNSSGILAAGANMVRIISTGANTAASFLLEIDHSTGAFTDSTNGMCIRSTDSGAAAGTSYNTYIASTSNRGLYVAPNAVISCADTKNLDALTITQLDATNDKDGIVCAVTGDGYILKGTVNTATGKGLGLICATAQTTSLLTLDGTTTDGFYGADGVGLLDINCDGALAHVGSTLIDASFSGTAQAASTGYMMNLRDTAAASAGSYVVQVISTNNNLLKLTCTDATKNAINVVTGISDFNGRANLGGLVFLDETAQTLTGAGAINVTALKTLIVTTANPDALTLANGAEGQIKIIKMKTDGGDGVLTPTTPHGFATITFNDVGDSCMLMFMDGGWIILGQNGCTVA